MLELQMLEFQIWQFCDSKIYNFIILSLKNLKYLVQNLAIANFRISELEILEFPNLPF